MLLERNYDVAIIAPGPTINELNHCFGPKDIDGNVIHNVSLVYFGVSFGQTRINLMYEKHKYCLELIAAREPVSFEYAKQVLPKRSSDQFDLLLSGDMSFSYLDGPYVPPVDVPTLYPQIFSAISQFKETAANDWVLIFSRENNFGPGLGVNIIGKKVYVTTSSSEKQTYDLDKVIFGSSDENQDSKHLRLLRRQYGIPPTQTVVVRSVEEMFCLISYSNVVVTDRYHPGVASFMLGKKVILTMYKQEGVKMAGLKSMMTYTQSKIRELNRKALKKLLKVITDKKPKHHRREGRMQVVTNNKAFSEDHRRNGHKKKTNSN